LGCNCGTIRISVYQVELNGKNWNEYPRSSEEVAHENWQKDDDCKMLASELAENTMLTPLIHGGETGFIGTSLSLVRRYTFLTVYGVVKYLPTPIGDVLRSLWLKLFMKRFRTFWVKEGTTFHFPENIAIGNSAINEFVYFNGYGGIDIGDLVMIGAGSMFYSHDHGIDDLDTPMIHQGLQRKPILIKDNVFIGCGVRVLGNVTIEEGAVVGAGSVVTSDVPSNAIVGGIPARVIRYRGQQP
jgi:acetyltransferase-like isoleucine patch superfamily enzyme